MNSKIVPIRVLVADDHPLMLDGIAAVLEVEADIQLVAQATNGKMAVEFYRSLRPDVVLMDLQMPGLNGIEAIRIICGEDPRAKVAVLTTYQGDVRVLQAMEAGAIGYLLKSSLRKELIETIRKVAKGQRCLPQEVATDLALHIGGDVITCRELEILRLVAQGDSNKRISSRLGIGEETVKGHGKNIISKLGANNRTHAVTIGIKRGILDNT
jgi:DNA-binding NarL/FixJ family response regulator